MNQPHKHAALIKAWADGAEIETRPYSDAACPLADFDRWANSTELTTSIEVIRARGKA